jgi:hypothetical protein
MNRRLSTLGFATLLLAAGPVLVAQSITTGGMNGVVSETNGQPVADATVRVVSGQITRTVVTNAEGRYFVPLLNPGAWRITISKTGYVPQSQTVNVGVNQTATSNFKLGKESGAVVAVVATAATVDASSTTTGSTYSLSSIESIPKGRDMNEIAYMAPGVSVSGFGAVNGNSGRGLEISIAGASGAENSFSVDGLKTNDMRYGGQSVAMINEFVDQIDIQTGGFKPEYSAMGGVFNALTKSGSNNFAGSTWLMLSPESLSPGPKRTPWTKELPAASVYDVGAWVGGALIKDKFFYSLGVNYQLSQSPSYTNLSDIRVGDTKTPNIQYLGKLQYFANTDNQFTFSYFGNKETATLGSGGYPSNLTDGRGDANWANDTTNDASNISLIWDSTLSSNMTLSLKAGQASKKNDVTPVDSRPAITDGDYYNDGGRTRFVTGGGPDRQHDQNKSTQFSGDFNWILGNHALKAGYSYLKSNYTEFTQRGSFGYSWSIRTTGGAMRAIRNEYTNDSEANAVFQAIYLQDTWQVNKDLLLFYGIRMEDQAQKGNNGSTFMHFKFSDYIQPRIGFTWDVLGTSLSKVSGSFANYYMQIPQRMAIRTYGHEDYFLHYFGGADTPHSTATYDRTRGIVSVTGPYYAEVNYSTGWSNDPLADNIKLPKRMEIQLGYDQQVSETTTLGIHGRYRKLTSPIEDSEITDRDGVPRDPADPGDGGGQAILWNPGSSVSWISPFSHQRVTVNNTLYPEAYNEYKAVDLSYTYKTESAYLYVGYTWSRNYGTYEGLISPTNGQPDGGITASWDYWPYVGTGFLPTDHTHALKAYGFKKFKVGPGALNVGFNFLAQSGAPYSLQDEGSTSTPPLPDPGGYGNSDFQNLLMGNKGRTPTQTRLDITLKYEMLLSDKVKLEPMFEVYNVFNSRPATHVIQQLTNRYGEPTAEGRWSSADQWQAGRSLRFGVKLQF